MKIVSRVLDVVCLVFKWLTAALLAVMLVVSLVEIVRRYILGASFPWADELIRYCIVGVASLGGSVAYRQAGGLVAFDLLQTNLKGKLRLVLELVINTIVLVFAAYILRNSILNLQMPSIKNQISIGLGISMFWPYLPISIGMGIIVVLALEKYYTIIHAFRSGAYNKKAIQPAEGGDSV